MDRLTDPGDQFGQFRHVEVFVLGDRHQAAKGVPTGRGGSISLGVNPFQRQFPTKATLGRHPRNRVFGNGRARGVLDPFLQVFFGHLFVVGDQPREIHGVVHAGVVQVESQLVINLQLFLDLLEFLNFHTEDRLGDAMLQQHLLVRGQAKRFQLVKDFVGGHRNP